MSEKRKAKKQLIRKPKPEELTAKDFDGWVRQQAQKTGKSESKIVEETFKEGFIVVSEVAGEGSFKVESGQLFKSTAEGKGDDLTECRRLRERFGPISSCVDYIKDLIMGSGFDIILENIKDPHQQDLKKELQRWMDDVYQDAYTIGLNSLLDIIVDNALTDGFGAAEMVFQEAPKGNSFFDDYAKPLVSTIVSTEGGRLQKSDYTSYEIKDPEWSDLKGISRLKIILDATTRLRLYRKTLSWEANYWVLDEPSTSGVQTGMNTASQKNLQQDSSMQITKEELTTASYMKKGAVTKPSAYFLPWQVFCLSMNRRNWLEKGPSIILPALKTAQLLEKIMNAVGEGIYRAGNKKYFIICGTKDRPWGPVHIRNLLSVLKDSSEKNWSTIPVPAGFDLKEAGGTVFEAQNAINYFLRVIAGIMHVNPSVLGLDTREARNVTEYPYFTHLRVKESFINQIRTQLIRMHIWTKYGQKKSKQGGYNEPQWIPHLRVRTEDLLNPSDRLKLDIDLLNSANPVRPQVKLEVERDIVKVRGWEVILPTQEEFEKEQEAAEKEMKAQLAAKEQGKPEPPSEEKQQKRLEEGVNVGKTESGKEKIPPPSMGSTRTPRENKKIIQESLTGETIPQTVKVGDTFVITNPFGAGAKTVEKDGIKILASEIITIEVRELTDALARYNKDLTKIYMDPLVPIEFYKPIIAHEIFEYLYEEVLGESYAKSEKLATQLENSLITGMGMNAKVYERKCSELMVQVSKREGVKNPTDVVVHSEVQESEKESQKVDVNITVKAEKPQKQEVEITLKDDEEKKAEEKELRDKKKKVLDKIEKKLEEE